MSQQRKNHRLHGTFAGFWRITSCERQGLERISVQQYLDLWFFSEKPIGKRTSVLRALKLEVCRLS